MANRIESAMKKAELNQTKLASAMNVTPQAVQQWISGITSPKGKRLSLLATVLGVSVEYLVSGIDAQLSITKPMPPIASNAHPLGVLDPWDETTPLNDDEVALPYLREVELSAGSGKYEVVENNVSKLRFSKETLRRLSVQKEHAWCVTVAGNSMEPVLPDGATVGIDKASTKIKDGHMYAIDHDGHLRIKRLYLLPNGVLRVRSYNDEWPDEHYTPEECVNIRILGRVFWYSVLV